jgi:hypothetical protein
VRSLDPLTTNVEGRIVRVLGLEGRQRRERRGRSVRDLNRGPGDHEFPPLQAGSDGGDILEVAVINHGQTHDRDGDAMNRPVPAVNTGRLLGVHVVVVDRCGRLDEMMERS